MIEMGVILFVSPPQFHFFFVFSNYVFIWRRQISVAAYETFSLHFSTWDL